MSFFDVAIINYNTRDLLRACLETVFRENPNRVIVVDNASSDGSSKMVVDEFRATLLLENQVNCGFSTGANQAIAVSTAKYILLLNSDTRLVPGTLSALEGYLEWRPDVAIVGPRLLNRDGSLQRSTFPFPTLSDMLFDVSNLSRLVRAVPGLRDRFLRTWAHDRVRSVPSVLGAALAIRREAFEQVKGFDETFYMYYEEIDLCYRLKQIGWKIHYVPAASIIHIGGASTQQQWIEMSVQLYSSLAHFYRLHYTPRRTAQLVALIKVIAMARLVRDKVSIHLARNADVRNQLDRKIAVWRRLLSPVWEQEVAYR